MNLNNISLNNDLLKNHIFLTKNILNMAHDSIINFLNLEYCNKELSIFSQNIHEFFDDNQLKCITNLIHKKYNIHDISKYYIKITHLFASIFNITSNNFNIQNNKLHISFNIKNSIPELKYLYTYLFDKKKNEYIFNNNHSQKYYSDLNFFCNIFLNKNKKYYNYTNLNINNITNKNIKDIIIFENNFHKYTHYLTILIQNIKKTHNILMKTINKYFIFDKDHDDNIFIKNIISMEKLNKIIKEIREIIINYFLKIDSILKKTKYFLKIFILEEFNNTINTRIEILSN